MITVSIPLLLFIGFLFILMSDAQLNYHNKLAFFITGVMCLLCFIAWAIKFIVEELGTLHIFF